jgi:hypothetical protein
LVAPAKHCAVPTQIKATQLAVALAVWATQRSDPDSNVVVFFNGIFSRLPLDNDDVAIVKKRKETKKRKKRNIWGEGCFGERPNPKITTSLFGYPGVVLHIAHSTQVTW